MTVGNAWLGSVQLNQITGSQNLATNSFNMQAGSLSISSIVDEVLIKIAVTCTETLTIAKVPAAGTAYSTIIYAVNTSGHTSFYYQPDRPMLMYPGDVLKVNVSNGNLTGQIYGEILAAY